VPGAAPVIDIYVARQPIFQRDGGVTAYELLYRRNGRDNFASGMSPDSMASDVIIHAFLNIGIERITDGQRAFLNFTRDMLLSGVHQLFTPTQVVIELLETVEPDADVMRACEALVSAGYMLALDDFEYNPKFDRLLGLAHIVKVDVLGKTDEELESIAHRLAPHNVRLLAERVETREMQARCAALGFELFQGYFFSKPEILSKRDLTTDELSIVRLLNLLRDPDATDTRVEDAFRADLALSFKLLRTVNSAATGGRGIESIQHAVRLVGRRELHKWLALLLLSSVTAKGGTDRELARMAVVRARLCELLAGARATAGSHFIVGLFSLLDVILRMPMADMLERVDLAEEVRAALLTRDGPLSRPLLLVEAYERAEWQAVERLSTMLELLPASVQGRYVEAVAWANQTVV
jgi:EAL and modified HD-GYP domain-containing signal transduction protein